MTRTYSQDQAVSAMARQLFVPIERLGWEYVAPRPAQASPALALEPIWMEPPPPDLRSLAIRQKQAKDRLPKACVFIGLVALLGLAQLTSAFGVFALLAALVMAGIWISPVITLGNQLTTAHQNAQRNRVIRWAAFQQEHASWSAAVAHHNHGEMARLATAMHWFPLVVRPTAGRIDVFGGDGSGRSVLLAVLGASLLATGNRMTVLDLTDEDVSRPLAALTLGHGLPVMQTVLPEDLETIDLLAGLDPQDTTELLTSALHPRRRGEPNDDRRDLAADLILTVLSRLEARPTIRRLVAGLRALNNTYDAAAETALTPTEASRLTDAAHDTVTGDRAKDELRSLISRLQLLAGPGSGTTVGRGLITLAEAGLRIISTTAAGNDRRKDLVDRLLVTLSIRAVHRRNDPTTSAVLVVAGADHLGPDTLESLARHARRSRTRVVFMFDHLREDVRPLLGSPGSATVLMQLGNADEAAAAATFIGRGHRFVLSQVSRQRGITTTVGGGDSSTEQVSDSFTEGSSQGWSRQGLQGGSNGGTSQSRSRGASRSQSTNTTWSLADSRTDGQVDARVYEFTVEPTEIQALPPSAFVLVDNSEGVRRIAMGNCDPRITELDRVSPRPR